MPPDNRALIRQAHTCNMNIDSDVGVEMDGPQLLSHARAALCHPGSAEERRKEFPVFYATNPRLFDIICSGRCDLRHLEMMVDMLGQIDTGTKTVEEASSVVANTLNLTYIESVIGTPTPEQALKPGTETKVTVVEGALPAPPASPACDSRNKKRTRQ